MLKKHTILLPVFAAALMSCTANMQGDKTALYDNGWELEYITGPRIAFQGLYPDEKPMITFNKDTKMVNGTSSCNGYNTTYTMSGKTISFATPATTTMRYCGDGEQVFLTTMQKVNGYRIDADGKLTLLMNDVPMMRFKKTSKM